MTMAPRTICPRRVRGALAGACLLAALAAAPSSPAGAAGTTTTTTTTPTTTPTGTVTPEVSPPCGRGDLRVTGSTNEPRYGPATWVKLTAAITNVSTGACTIAVGPSWPALSVANAKGIQVWNSCSDNDRIGGCPQFLALRTLEPGATYTTRAAWDQGQGPRRTRVPLGAYRFVAALNGVTSPTDTLLIASASSRTITVTQLASGHSVTLRPGDRLVVRLGTRSRYTWSAVNSSNPALLTRLAGTATTTIFRAQRRGQTQVTATDSPNCHPQCLAPSQEFTLQVTVSPSGRSESRPSHGRPHSKEERSGPTTTSGRNNR